MRLLVKSQLRFLARSPWSSTTALVGVALGVASVVAVHLIGVEVQRSLAEATPPHLETLTHVLSRDRLEADDYFELRRWWRDHPHLPIRGLVPLVEGTVTVGGGPIRLVGADWLAMPPVDPSVGAAGPQTGSAAAPGIPSDVLLGRSVLVDADVGFAEGDIIRLGERDVAVARVLQTGSGPVAFADIALAQIALASGPNAVHRVGIAIRDPWQPWRRRLDDLMPGFGAGLPAERATRLTDLIPAAETSTLPGAGEWRAMAVETERPGTVLARSVLFNLGALGTLALLVAWFLIHQVAVIWLRRQHLVLERLHALGAAPATLRRAFVLLFVALGAVATVLGLVLGVLLATALVGLSSAAVDVSLSASGARALEPWVLAKAVISGVGVCLVGAIGAFAAEWQSRGPAAWRRWTLPVLVAAVVAGIGLEASGVIGGFLAILAMSLLAVATVAPVLTALRRALSGRWRGGRLLDRMALREVVWYPRMLSVALAALAVAVATSIGIGLMVESFRADFQRMLDVRLAGDLYVYDAGGRAEAVAAWLERQPAVARVSRFGEARARVGGVPVEVGFARFDAVESSRYGFPRPLAPGEALVSERLLRDLDVAVGERLEAAAGRLEVVGTFPGFGDPQGRVLVDAASLDRLALPAHFTRISATLTCQSVAAPPESVGAPSGSVGAPSGSVGAPSGREGPASDPAPRLECPETSNSADALAAELTARFPGVALEHRAVLRARSLEIFDRTFAITQALTLLALVVAGVGTYNALTALRLQQAPTTSLLQAAGVTAAEQRRVALLRAGAVGAVAVVLALPLGLAMAWTLCAVINPRSFGWTVELHLPVSGWLPPLLLGLVAALLAGALPAPRERGALDDAA